jgi:hypothetical protein
MAEILLNYKADDINKYLKAASEIESTIKATVAEELTNINTRVAALEKEVNTYKLLSKIKDIINSTVFKDSVVGTYSFSDNKISIIYTSSQTESISTDLNTLLKSINPTEIIYAETAYTWNETAFVDSEGNDITNTISTSVSGTGDFEKSLILDNIEIIYLITI